MVYRYTTDGRPLRRRSYRWHGALTLLPPLLDAEVPAQSQLLYLVTWTYYVDDGSHTICYGIPGRALPACFPNEPIEKLHDPGRKDWQDLLYGLRKATVANEDKRKLITFAEDMQHWELNDYQSYLPQTVKHYRRGNTIIVENPKEFDKWLGRPQRSGLLSRLLGREK